MFYNYFYMPLDIDNAVKFCNDLLKGAGGYMRC